MSALVAARAPLAPPTLDQLRDRLGQALGAEFASTWITACSTAGLAPDDAQLDDDQFDRLLTGIGVQSPLCRVMAMSWRIRRTAARRLDELGR